MFKVFFVVGLASALPLLALLLRTRFESDFRVWPTPGPGTWQHKAFWPLFRTLNVATFATAIVSDGGWLGIPETVRILAVVALLGFGALYIFALVALGHANTYCHRSGLVTHGFYRWTRNPQYATIIPVYACLLIAADNAAVSLLCVGMIGVYVLMAIVEEPWLRGAYGTDYTAYCRHVPRFFNWHRAGVMLRSLARSAQRAMGFRLSDATHRTGRTD